MLPLKVICPCCEADLMDHETVLDGNASIGLNLRLSEEVFPLHLSSIYGSFRFDTNVQVGMGEQTELFCPACDHALVVKKECDICAASLAMLALAVDGDVYFCSRRGCKNHKVELRDPERSLGELYGDVQKQGLQES